MDKIKVCYVKGCLNSQINETGRIFFALPSKTKRNPTLCQQWISFTQNNSINQEVKRPFGYICDQHFKNEDFLDETRQKLHCGAIPSLLPQLTTASTSATYNLVTQETDSLSVPSLSSSPTLENHGKNSILCTPENILLPNSLISSTPIPPSKCSTRLPFSTPLDQSTLLDSYSCSSGIVELQPEASDIDKSTQLNLDLSITPNRSSSLTLSSVKMTRFTQLNTPRRQFLFNYGRNKDKELKRLQRKYRNVKMQLTKLSDKGHSEKELNNFCQTISKVSAVFLSSYMRNSKIKPRGRRWTNEEKALALSLYKKSPKCYSLLRSIWALPSKRTLLMLLNKIPFSTGINEQVLSALTDAVGKLNGRDKVCALLFDEMSIRENFYYNRSTDRIEGFQDLGHLGRNSLVANHALVFMVRGLIKKWKQPVAYYFTNGGTSSKILEELIVVVLDACHKAGLCVIATVCDMGSTNVKAIKSMGSRKSKPYFMHKGNPIFTIYDPPHLLKCTRNMLLKHNVKCRVTTGSLDFDGVARWDDIQTAYDLDKSSAEFRMLHKLKDSHLEPIGAQKMKVGKAAQVLSHSVAAAIMVYVQFGSLPSSALATSTFIKMCDELFDSFNGNSYNFEGGKKLKTFLRDGSAHLQFWTNALQIVDSWQFQFEKVKDGISKQVIVRPPSQNGWLITMRAVMLLWTYLKDTLSLDYLCIRNLNQDPLENLFGSIRNNCGSNYNPTVGQFVGSFKTCIINGLAFNLIVKNGNCENDNADILSTLQTFLGSDCSDMEVGANPENPLTMDDENHGPVACSAAPDIPSDMALMSTSYVSGYIVRRLLAKYNCDDCGAGLCCKPSDDFYHAGIAFKEYNEEYNRLTYPSEKFVYCVTLCANLVDKILNERGHQNDLSKIINDCIRQTVTFEWFKDFCVVHWEDVYTTFIESIVKLCIPWWCTRSNRQRVSKATQNRKNRILKHC